jgi:hypothetical protein
MPFAFWHAKLSLPMGRWIGTWNPSDFHFPFLATRKHEQR